MVDSTPDPILEVAGIPAATILERCTALRKGWRGWGADTVLPAAATPADSAALPSRTSWRLLDFADLPDAEFVAAVHLAMLGRQPYARETIRRISDLTAGMTRIEVIARLAFSPEGRRMRHRSVGGLALPVLGGLARLLELFSTRRAPRARLEAPSAGQASGGSGVAAWFRGLRQLGRMHRELAALRQEIEDLRRRQQK